MNTWKNVATIAVVATLVASATGCSAFGAMKASGSDVVAVTAGDLRITVAGTGKTVIAEEDALAFATSGRIENINVRKGDNVSTGQVLARLDTADMEQTLTQAKLALAKQQLAVEQAELAVRVAEHSLDEARDRYTWPDIEVAQTQVDEAKAYVDYINSNLAKGGGASWSGPLAYATAKLAAAEQRLDAMIHSYDTEEVAIKKIELHVAQDALALAEQSVGEAEGTIKQVERQIGDSVIRAQFDGVVTGVDVEAGDVVSPAVKIVHLIDPKSLEVYAEIEEMDVLGVRPGQQASVKVDALPGVSLDGMVLSVSQLPIAGATGLVKYETRVKLVDPPAQLKSGLSASSNILVEERKNVLLAPSRTVKRSGNVMTVKVVDGTESREVAVVTGATDGTYTEIVSGLKAGDSVSTR